MTAEPTGANRRASKDLPRKSTTRTPAAVKTRAITFFEKRTSREVAGISGDASNRARMDGNNG